jgi:hypothetical protein
MRFFENGQSRLYKIKFLLQTKVLKQPIRPKPSILLGSVRYSEIEREYFMATARQIQANRRNAQKSTGPKTARGRAAVRWNGLKHGLNARTLILPGEDRADFKALLHSLQAEHQPATPRERKLVIESAKALWRARRILRKYHYVDLPRPVDAAN